MVSARVSEGFPEGFPRVSPQGFLGCPQVSFWSLAGFLQVSDGFHMFL